ncbi:hypothetical protein OGAPHI_000768 [Ogataea philodendri]|uniref:Mitochondrial carrier n=1 Tax=Ogataea philodendri TaxID=1378263 RepID=A0A9P8PFG0_9ASCO|nr:uncharacterized protein OGAPHI_000768 [Ogataea philodendri]KAH3671057.1 hypothetical protein OGAPHI_000768 [Ogataea philodendri]
MKDSTFWPSVPEPALSLVCGGIAGALSRTTVSPMERVKVLQQVQGSTNSYRHGTLRSIHQIWQEEGYKGLYRGNGINCVRVVPYSAVQYSVFQALKSALADSDGSWSIPRRLFAGTVAGFMSVLATYPMDLVKTRLSVQTAALQNLKHRTSKEAPPGMWASMLNIYRTEGGIKALYRGLIPTSLGVAPYTALNFTIYGKLKDLVPERARNNPSTALVLGAISGGVGQTLIYPMDVLRRRFQVATLGGGEMGFQYKSTPDALVQIVQREGYVGLYKGWGANMWKICPSMAVQWMSYDLIRRVLE